MRLERICGHTFSSTLIRQTGVVVDCGANRGDFSNWIATHLQQIRVYAFEPDPRIAASSAYAPNVCLQHFAVTAHGNETTLWLGKRKCSSIRHREHDGQTQVTVPSTTLDNFCAAEGVDRIDLLKLDIEGSELDVLPSISEQLLRRIGQVTVEFHDFLEKSDEERIRACISRLKTMGFHCVRFSWFDYSDVLFINTHIHFVGLVQAMRLRATKYSWGFERYLHRTYGSGRSS